jgi:hypothetical protein
MLNTVFHTSNPRLLAPILAHAFGPALFVMWLPFAIAGVVAMARRGWWPGGVLSVVPLVMLPLFWFGLPVNVDSRFLLPAIGPALLPMAFAFTRDRRWNRALAAVYVATMAWLLVGIRASLPAPNLPWFMQGWLSLDGLLQPQFLAWFIVVVLVISATWWLSRSRREWLLPATASVVAMTTAALATSAQRWCHDSPCVYIETTPPVFRAAYVNSWNWLAANVSGATIAYTGINLPYPLTGPRLTNRVVYVNIDGRAHWRLHDYDHAFRSGRFAPGEPRLAKSSGELLPVGARTGPRDDASRPRYERMQGIPEAWAYALESEGVRYLYVAALSAYEVDYVWHTDRGFPIEDIWAQSDRTRFHLVYENPQVHIYSVEPARRARA